jgi:methylmalonyl-CoA/ethylmalonyl-CoA epimerase
MADAPTISVIGQIGINIKNLERATAFYRDALGLKFLFSVPPNMAFFDCGGVRLLLDIAEDKQYDHPSSVIYFKVADIHDSFAKLERSNVEIVNKPHKIASMPDHDLWMGFFKDSEGNTLSLMSEVKRA